MNSDNFLPSGGATARPRNRKFSRWGVLLAMTMLVGGLVTATSTAKAVVKPSDPTGVTATVGDKEATISWSSGGTGNGGTCASDEYYVNVYDASQWQYPNVAESVPITSGTSWFVDELSPSTRYYVEVEAYGYACEEYSNDLGEAYFTTNASNSGSDPAAPSPRKKRAPRPVRHLTPDTSISGQVTIAWQRPAKLNNAARKKRCAYTTSAAADFPSITYNYYVYNLTTGEDIVDLDFTTNENHGSRDIDISSVPAGQKLEATVTAYSEQCGFWSNARSVSWWT